jgi:magnesium transporter
MTSHLPRKTPYSSVPEQARDSEAAPLVTVIDYDEGLFEEKELTDLSELSAFRDTATISWINIIGPVSVERLGHIGDIFKLHPLTIEDIKNTGQRPKMEDMVDYIYISAKVFYFKDKKGEVKIDQLSIIVGKNYVLTFQEDNDRIFDPIREKLRKYKGRIRRMGSDYLTYRLMGAVIDGYFAVLEKVGEKLEYLEEMVVTNPNPTVLRSIHGLRIEMTYIYRYVWPLREVVGALTREELPLIRKSNEAYFRDIYDHTIQIIETMETDRDMISGMLDIYVSSMSNKMNEIMKTLTVIATIFIPMTFFAGVWGMNFKHMPELEWQWAEPTFWLFMIAIAVALLLFFRKRKWL